MMTMNVIVMLADRKEVNPQVKHTSGLYIRSSTVSVCTAQLGNIIGC